MTKQLPSAYDVAVRLLGMREHSRFELEQKLMQRGYDAEQIAPALDQLEEQRYLDDARFAQILFRSNPELGVKGLSAQMAKRGIDRRHWQPLLNDLTAEDELERAYSAAKRRSGTLPEDWEGREKWKRRMVAYLGRRGFSLSTALSVCSRILGE